MKKCWLFKNGYWEGPEEEMQSGAIEVPKRPAPSDKWDGSQWIRDPALAKTEMQGPVLLELRRINKFLLLPKGELAAIQTILDAYVATLRATVENPPPDMKMPTVPSELTDEAFFG